MRKSTIKSLLLGLLMTAGVSSAWAGETTTTYDFEDGNAVFTGRSRITVAIENNSDLSSNVVGFTGAGNAQNGYCFADYDFTSLVESSSLTTISFDYYNTKGGRSIMTIGDATLRGTTGGSSKVTYGSVGAIFRIGSDKSNFFINGTNLSQDTYCDKWLNVNVVVDPINKKVSYTVKDHDGSVLKSEENIAYWQSADNCTQIDLFGYINNSHMAMVDNLSITKYVDESATYADYTVVWKNSDTADEIKSVTRNGQVGTTISLNTSDIESFYNDDKTVKYIYVNDDAESTTIAEDGSSVVTINFREADTYDYTVNAVDAESNVLTELASGSCFEGDTKTVYWSKYIKVDDQWYVTESPYGLTVSEDGTQTVTYTVSDITYFVETSDMNGYRAAATKEGNEFSEGVTGRHFKGSAWYTEPLEGGVYTVSFPYTYHSSQSSSTLNFSVRSAAGLVEIIGENSFSGSGTYNLEGVEIPAGGSFQISEPGNYNSNYLIDYVVLTKTDDITSEIIPVTTGAGFITYVTKNAIQIPSDIYAYVVAAVGETAVLSQVQEVPAGTPIIVEAAQSETGYECNVIASAEEPADNWLKVSDGSVVGDGTGTIYALANINDVVGFYPVKDGITVPAGKAYIVVEEEEAPVKGYLALGDEADAINNIAVEAANGAIYNIAGQKMESIKNGGLYIVNGKKVIVK